VRRVFTLLAMTLAGLSTLALSTETRLPANSLYQLQARLLTQTGDQAGLDLYRGYPTLVSMFYGSCPAACPMLITSMQVYESHLDPAARSRLRVLLISFDAEHDTPQQLEKLLHSHGADPTRWTFSSASETDARKIAALLGFRYRKLPDGSFDHSLLITLLDGEGQVVATTTTLVGDAAFQAKLQAATAVHGP
jgi:protein SCO1/2